MVRRQIASVRGVSVEISLVGVSACFLLLLAIDLFLVSPVIPDPSQSVLLATSEMLILILATVGHELGHAMVWQSFGVPVYRCEMHGLYAKTVRESTRTLARSRQALAVVAGPCVNLILALLVLPLLTLPLPLLWTTLIQYAFLGNLALAATNLIPLDPLDGGRIRRLLLQQEQRFTPSRKGPGNSTDLRGLQRYLLPVERATLRGLSLRRE